MGKKVLQYDIFTFLNAYLRKRRLLVRFTSEHDMVGDEMKNIFKWANGKMGRES